MFAIVMVRGSEEDKRTFPTFNFMKSKLCNHLIVHFDLALNCVPKKFISSKLSPSIYCNLKVGEKEIALWKLVEI